MWKGDSRVSFGAQLENAKVNSKRKGRRVVLFKVVITCALGERYGDYKVVRPFVFLEKYLVIWTTIDALGCVT